MCLTENTVISYKYTSYLSNGDFVVRVAPGSLSLTRTNNGWNRKSNRIGIFFIKNMIFFSDVARSGADSFIFKINKPRKTQKPL